MALRCCSFIVLCLMFEGGTNALQHVTNWQRLPHIERRDVFRGAAAASVAFASGGNAASTSPLPRSLVPIDQHPIIPVWPSWAGGRVVPVSLDINQADPFLLLAHHKHWFDPRDPLRKPFQAFGKATGLPYIDVEGFKMHPHRGFDILTYILDGSDGFQHKDSLGGSRTYHGGQAQWMRCGSGVLHEEFWETRSDRRTDIELFQIWINLPRERKFDEPAVRYVGKGTDHPWEEHVIVNDADKLGRRVVVRNIGATLESATTQHRVEGSSAIENRPPVNLQHVRLDSGAEWTVHIPRQDSAVVYVREGVASLPSSGKKVPALQTATFAADGDIIVIRNDGQRKGDTLDLLLMTGAPLREPVAMGGPIVMNTEREINDAYRQLSDGSFLDRERVLRQQNKS